MDAIGHRTDDSTCCNEIHPSTCEEEEKGKIGDSFVRIFVPSYPGIIRILNDDNNDNDDDYLAKSVHT